jgi:transcriptional regulator with XRE-family HTH domain
MSDWQEQVSARVAAIRRHRGMSLSALAARAGVSKATLSGIESGRGNPTLDTIERLAVALAIPVGDLLSREGPGTTVRRSPQTALDELSRIEGDSIVEDLLVRIPGGRSFEFWRLRMAPGEHFAGVHHTPGTVEIIVVITGTMTAGPDLGAEAAGGQEADAGQADLGPGDLIEFDGDQPHTYTAGPTGCQALVALGSTSGAAHDRAGAVR